ncbi:phenylalanine--tRNA ligase subunit alpha [Candidatus Azambacteria bacterium]|nr:phenylalanine--tRNA ligase subunit alpha [Candidatus Azambacteria bacterium]
MTEANIKALLKEAEARVKNAGDFAVLETLRIGYLGRKGKLTEILRSLKELAPNERRRLGALANAAKKTLEALFEERTAQLSRHGRRLETLDVTRPGVKLPRGHVHPLMQAEKEIAEIFSSMGFSIVEGPELETEWYNFDALNIPKWHPARETMQTFWIKGKQLLLRTHTSPVQIRYMEKHDPPFRIIALGRCFRRDATDATHDFQFYQVEGLMVGKDVSIPNFKAIVEAFFSRYFKEKNVKVRLRPSYFPFVEPGFEIDVSRKGKWLEIGGAGMVHPAVFKAAGYVPANQQGFAFGWGIDRLVMLKYNVDDIRHFYGSDLRFLKQF